MDAQEVAREFLSLWAPDKWDSVSFRTLLPPFDCDEPPVYRKIGSNLFADMFDHMGSGNMVKVASTQGWAQWLWSEFLCHHRVYTAFSTNDAICQVPRIYKYVTGDRTEWWDRNGLLICDPGDSPPQSRAALITQRIVQVPKVARQALVRLFWPQKSTKSALSNLSSHDCLMHIHLGKGGPLFPAADSFMISPRNLTLNLNQICWLGLPILDYSGAIGEALALMHWSVRVDGSCVKFVLGSEAHSIKPVEYGPQSLLRSMTLRLFISWSR